MLFNVLEERIDWIVYDSRTMTLLYISIVYYISYYYLKVQLTLYDILLHKYKNLFFVGFMRINSNKFDVVLLIIYTLYIIPLYPYGHYILLIINYYTLWCN